MRILKNYFPIIYLGIIWGMTELVIGYFLHMLKTPVTGALLMPVGIICMINVYMKTGSKVSIVLTSVIAALFKLVTIFFVPVSNLYLVINPVVAILLEGLVLVIPISLIIPATLILPSTLILPATLIIPSPLKHSPSLLHSTAKNPTVINRQTSLKHFLIYFGLFYASIFFYKICFLSFQILLKGETGAPALGLLSISDNFNYLISQTFISVFLVLGYLFLRQKSLHLSSPTAVADLNN